MTGQRGEQTAAQRAGEHFPHIDHMSTVDIPRARGEVYQERGQDEKATD
jgi:hypothetical protein